LQFGKLKKPTWDDDIDISDIVEAQEADEGEDAGLSEKKKKKKRRARAFAEKHQAMARKQEAYTPTSEQGPSKEEIAKYFDEYYKLDYEDLVRQRDTRRGVCCTLVITT
jgi:hypothetical protein